MPQTGRPARRRQDARGLFRSWQDHYLSEYCALFEQIKCSVDVSQRKRAVDHGLQLAALHEFEQLLDVLAHPAVGAQYLQLVSPDVTDVFLRVKAGRGAAGKELALPVQDAQRR